MNAFNYMQSENLPGLLPDTIQAVNAAFGLLLWGTGTPARYLFIMVLSSLSAVLVLKVFKRFSDQARLGFLRNRIQGNILQISLYPDRFGIIAGSLRAVLADTVRSLGQSVIPLVVMFVPLAVVMIEVNTYCGSAPILPGSEFTIRVEADAMNAGDSAHSGISLETSPGITLETDALRIPQERSILWRAKLQSAASGKEFVRVRASGGESAEKTIAANRDSRRFGSKLQKWSPLDGLLTNAEGFLPDSAPVKAIVVSYPRAGYWFVFWDIDALLLYVILTLIIAAGVRPFMGVHV